MTDADFSKMLSEISNIPSCNDLRELNAELVAPLNLVLAEIQADASKLEELTNPATFIVNFIKLIKLTKTKKDDEALKLATQISQLKNAIASKASEFQNCTI